MDYIDRVYIDLKDREPSNFLMMSLKDPAKFIEAVKFLIDGGWLTNVYFDSSYSTLFITDHYEAEFWTQTFTKKVKPTWYDHDDTTNNTPTND